MELRFIRMHVRNSIILSPELMLSKILTVVLIITVRLWTIEIANFPSFHILLHEGRHIFLAVAKVFLRIVRQALTLFKVAASMEFMHFRGIHWHFPSLTEIRFFLTVEIVVRIKILVLVKIIQRRFELSVIMLFIHIQIIRTFNVLVCFKSLNSVRQLIRSPHVLIMRIVIETHLWRDILASVVIPHMHHVLVVVLSSTKIIVIPEIFHVIMRVIHLRDSIHILRIIGGMFD